MLRRKRDAERTGEALEAQRQEDEATHQYGWMTDGAVDGAPAPKWAPPPAAEEVAPATEEAPPKQPFWKRDVSVGGKSRQEADEKPRKRAKAERTPKSRRERKRGESSERAPFWKRELGRRATDGDEAEPAKEPRLRRRRAEKPSGERSAGGGRRRKQLVGLKIGASQLAAARVVSNGRIQVTQLAREPLERGIVVGGELRDPDALAEALKEFFDRHKLPKRNVRLGLANNRIGVRTLEVLGIDDSKQLANAIRFRAQEVLPIPIEETVLDYRVLEEGRTDEGETLRRILLVVAYRELVDRYVDACRRAGLRLAGIDLEAFALLRALGAPRHEDAGASALVAVAVGHDRTTLAVSDGRTCEFTRVLEWGGHALDVAVARALDVAPSAAEPLKRALSLHGAEAVDGLTAERAEAAREAMRKQVNAFARELVSSLQFYQGQPDSLPIAAITLTGGTSHLAGLAQELRRLIGVPVEVGDPLARAQLGKKVREDDQVGSFAIAVGLGIED
jgi:type IV pilus assembly protein PilM